MNTMNNIQMKPYPLGAHCEEGGIRFSFVSQKENCGIMIYDRKSGSKIKEIPFQISQKIGNVYCGFVTDYKASDILYQFYEEDRILPDERAVIYVGERAYGKKCKPEELKAGFLTELFDWQGDVNPRISYEDSICYLMHVRGFTKHDSSGVKEKERGTFRGIIEKLPYLQEIGITTVELQPAYEFLEAGSKEHEGTRINYWGYQKGYYYTPKAAYAADDPVTEFKELVRAFHQNGMELIMQFYFPKDIPVLEIPKILHYWTMEYHVDGFHLIGENLPFYMLTEDPVLAHTKLWYSQAEEACKGGIAQEVCSSALYTDDYMHTVRKFLKGDEDMVKSVMYHMSYVPEQTGRIHYLSNYYGFTIKDMVSYERKHNEENGEYNRDGSDYNCSWNCGEEGPSQRTDIENLRLRQIKNALCILMFSNSTPLIFMGDEFGNTQKGNNNPYCQDNEIAWLNWNDMEENKEIFSFWCRLAALRKTHSMLRYREAVNGTKDKGSVYPELSYHGEKAWRPETENYSRWLGMMLCGKENDGNGAEDEFFYLAMNMHWESHTFGLPGLPEGRKWQVLLSTGDELSEHPYVIPARSIVVYHSVAEAE